MEAFERGCGLYNELWWPVAGQAFVIIYSSHTTPVPIHGPGRICSAVGHTNQAYRKRTLCRVQQPWINTRAGKSLRLAKGNFKGSSSEMSRILNETENSDRYCLSRLHRLLPPTHVRHSLSCPLFFNLPSSSLLCFHVDIALLLCLRAHTPVYSIFRAVLACIDLVQLRKRIDYFKSLEDECNNVIRLFNAITRRICRAVSLFFTTPHCSAKCSIFPKLAH